MVCMYVQMQGQPSECRACTGGTQPEPDTNGTWRPCPAQPTLLPPSPPRARLVRAVSRVQPPFETRRRTMREREAPLVARMCRTYRNRSKRENGEMWIDMEMREN